MDCLFKDHIINGFYIFNNNLCLFNVFAYLRKLVLYFYLPLHFCNYHCFTLQKSVTCYLSMKKKTLDIITQQPFYPATGSEGKIKKLTL